MKYTIKVEVDDIHGLIEGDLNLEYTNNSPDSLKILYFRTIPNALQKGSPFHKKELGEGYDRFTNAPPEEYGYCEIKDFSDESGEKLEFTVNYSITRVELANPILPSENRNFRIDFTTRLPSDRLGSRLKRINGQYRAAHWFPQICPYDRELGWVNNQYLGWGEIYADIGDYSVSIDAPSEYIIAATGVLQNREEVLPDTLRILLERKNFTEKIPPDLGFLRGGRKTWHFLAEKVCDFVFVADSQFCLEEAEYEGIKIYAYARREHASQWWDAAEVGRKGMQFFSENFGRYAYPQISITDSWSGMEYPMLVMCGGESPDYDLTFWHEMAHNYFMAAVSTNQTDRAFLDEGFTTFLEIAAMEHYLGREDNLKIKDNRFKQLFYPHEEDRYHRGFRPYLNPALQGFTRPMPMNADKAPEWLIYRASSYYKPVCMLFALQYILGRDELFKCIREYYLQWKFKHPYEQDMFASFEMTSHMELTWFFEEWVYTDKKLDYKIHKPQLLDKEKGKYGYRLQVERIGEVVMPLRLEAKLRDGNTVNYWIPLNDNPPPKEDFIILPIWDQLRDPQSIYSAEASVSFPIDAIDLDPEGLLADVNPLNNCWPWPKVQWNWWVKENYPPVNAYQIRHSPTIGFNNIDGLELGWKFKGSFLDYSKHLNLSLNCGLLNFLPDWSLEYSNFLSKISPSAFWGISAFDINGYQGGDLALWWNYKPTYEGDPVSGVKLALQHRRNYDSGYPLLTTAWDKMEDNAILVRYWQDLPQTRGARMEMMLLNSIFGDDFNYSRLICTFNDKIQFSANLGLNLSFGGGFVKGNRIPAQRLFYLSGWDPETDRNYEAIGISGIIPTHYESHFMTRILPGLYGLYDERIGEKSYVGLSGELSLLPKLNLNLLGMLKPEIQPLVFSDIVYGYENLEVNEDYVWDAGPGIALNDIFGGDFRIMFPLWMNPSPISENIYDFRWVVSFTPKFEY